MTAVVARERVSQADRREARRQAMMDAALELFMERGYAGTGISDVVRRSGGSLSTFYELFGSKAGLFRAIVEAKSASIVAIFDNPDIDRKSPREALTELGHRLFAMVMGPEGMAAIRAIILEGAEYPELADTFFHHGPEVGETRVSAYLAQQTEKGRLRIADPQRASQQFCALIRGEFHLRSLCGLPQPLDAETRDRHIEETVAMFLRAYAAT